MTILENVIHGDPGLWDLKEAIKQITHDGLLDTISVMSEPNYDLKRLVQSTITKMADDARISGMFERAVTLGQINNPDTPMNWIAWARRNDFNIDHLQNIKNTKEQTQINRNEIPGKKPKNTINQIAVDVAWEIERKEGRRASADEVMQKLREFAENGTKYSHVLRQPRQRLMGGDVHWITKNNTETIFSLSACIKTLLNWHESRQKADSNPSK